VKIGTYPEDGSTSEGYKIYRNETLGKRCITLCTSSK